MVAHFAIGYVLARDFGCAVYNFPARVPAVYVRKRIKLVIPRAYILKVARGIILIRIGICPIHRTRKRFLREFGIGVVGIVFRNRCRSDFCYVLVIIIGV